MAEAEALSEQEIRAGMPSAAAAQLHHLDVFDTIDSTNRWLAGQPAPAPGQMHAAIADFQSAGRGRRGRHWEIPPGHGLCLSAARSLACPAERLPALTLALGVAVAEALEAGSEPLVKLKWPNDLVLNDGKLGGILCESATGEGRRVHVVAGVGVNLSLPDGFALTEPPVWGRGPVALAEAMEPPSRNRLAARMLASLGKAFDTYERDGLTPFLERWRKRDWLLGAEIAVEGEGCELAGIAAGLADDGALLVDTDNGQRRVLAGDVLRCRRARGREGAR